MRKIIFIIFLIPTIANSQNFYQRNKEIMDSIRAMPNKSIGYMRNDTVFAATIASEGDTTFIKRYVLGLNTATTTALAGKQYTINVQALTSSPTDGQTIYFGMLPKAPTTSANISKIYVRTASVIKAAEIYTYAGTAGTSESWSMYVRVNNATDYLIATVSAATNERVFSKTDFNISLNANDYFEIKLVNPTFATNPLTFIASGYIKLL